MLFSLFAPKNGLFGQSILSRSFSTCILTERPIPYNRRTVVTEWQFTENIKNTSANHFPPSVCKRTLWLFGKFCGALRAVCSYNRWDYKGTVLNAIDMFEIMGKSSKEDWVRSRLISGVALRGTMNCQSLKSWGRKLFKPPVARLLEILTGLNKSPKWRDRLHWWSNYQVVVV